MVAFHKTKKNEKREIIFVCVVSFESFKRATILYRSGGEPGGKGDYIRRHTTL